MRTSQEEAERGRGKVSCLDWVSSFYVTYNLCPCQKNFFSVTQGLLQVLSKKNIINSAGGFRSGERKKSIKTDNQRCHGESGLLTFMEKLMFYEDFNSSDSYSLYECVAIHPGKKVYRMFDFGKGSYSSPPSQPIFIEHSLASGSKC